MYDWIDPFEAMDEMERWAREREDEADRRLSWALAEVARHRVMVDTALYEAIQKYAAPDLRSQVSLMTATGIMDSQIARMLSR